MFASHSPSGVARRTVGVIVKTGPACEESESVAARAAGTQARAHASRAAGKRRKAGSLRRGVGKAQPGKKERLGNGRDGNSSGRAGEGTRQARAKPDRSFRYGRGERARPVGFSP